MEQYKDFFKDKKITVMGLGLLGRGVGDVKFLAECGADLIVTDLKNKEELKESLEPLKEFSNITYTLGEHRLEDFRNRNMVIKAAGVPLDSLYIDEARKNNIPIEMSTALFARLSGATIVGITGTRGKSTVTHLLHEVLQAAIKNQPSLMFQKVVLGGNVRGVSTLAMLPYVKSGDIAVLELDSWQLQGFGESKSSPHISAFTTFLSDHLNYYRGDIQKYFEDKANIFAFHEDDDVLIMGKDVAPIIRERYKNEIKSKKIIADPNNLSKDWELLMFGEHNRYNASIVLEIARELGVSDDVTREVFRTFKGVPGRLEFVKEVNGVTFYNDTTATTPDATLAALKALSRHETRNMKSETGDLAPCFTPHIVLVMGGADKNLDITKLSEALPEYCKKVVMLPGTGTDKILETCNAQRVTPESNASCFMLHGTQTHLVYSMSEAVREAIKETESGDIVLLSPAFASFGLFKNEFDRGEKFLEEIKKMI